MFSHKHCVVASKHNIFIGTYIPSFKEWIKTLTLPWKKILSARSGSQFSIFKSSEISCLFFVGPINDTSIDPAGDLIWIDPKWIRKFPQVTRPCKWHSSRCGEERVSRRKLNIHAIIFWRLSKVEIMINKLTPNNKGHSYIESALYWISD